jgi:hypothetical protein
LKNISWNVRGINNLIKQRCLKTLISDEKPSTVLLEETKCASITMEKMATRCWRGWNVTTVDVEGGIRWFGHHLEPQQNLPLIILHHPMYYIIQIPTNRV